MIKVCPCPDDLEKLRERAPAFGKAGFVRCQVAGDDVWRPGRRQQGPKIQATAQVCRRIYALRLAEKRISTSHKLRLWAGIVTIITGRHRVDSITAQSHQRSIFA